MAYFGCTFVQWEEVETCCHLLNAVRLLYTHTGISQYHLFLVSSSLFS